MTADPRSAPTDVALFRGLILALIPSIVIWAILALALRAVL